MTCFYQQPARLKLGFLGGGVNSAIGQTHSIAAQMDGHFEVVAGCFSRDESINQATAVQWGVSPDRVYSDMMSFLDGESARLDAVTILTPTPAHKQAIIACAEQGIPVICEKALVSDLDDIQGLAPLLKQQDTPLYVTFNYTGYPMVRELREWIRSRKLGVVNQILVEMPQEGFIRHRPDGSVTQPQPWRQQDGKIPTVSLDLGVHVHQLVDFLTGKQFSDVYAVNAGFGQISGVVDTVHCIARYDGGLICNYWYGKAALGFRNGLRIRIYGSKGSAEWLQMSPEQILFADEFGSVTVTDRTHPGNILTGLPRYNRFKAGHPAGFIEAFANYYADIAANISGHRNDLAFGFDVASEGLSFLDCVQRSALTGKSVYRQ